MLKKTLLFLILFLSVGFSVDAQTERKTIQRGTINGAAKHLPQPEYPPEAGNSCAEGKVEVEVLVYLATGKVIEAKATSGNELLRESAENAARQAQFGVPLITGEVNVNIKGILVYNFALPKNCVDIKRVVNEKAKFLPLPAFPKACRCSGNAFVQIIIDEMGNVIRATAISGHPLLRIEAERAARRAKFSPFYHGAGILVKAIIVYKFKPDGIVDTSIDKNGNSQSSVKKITISCGQCNSKAIFLAKPEYPEAAKAVRASGSVLVDILVNEKGNVESVKVKSGHPLLWSVSEKAALKSKFEPKLIGGNSVRFYSTIVYNFVSQ